MQATSENKRKALAKSLRSALKSKNRDEEGGTSRSTIFKKTRKHRSTGLEDDEGESGTIYNANISIGK
jgi:hypothetical protein